MNIVRRALVLLLVFFGAAAEAWEAMPQKIAEGVYALVGETGPRTVANEGMNATTGFIVTEAGVVVIDSGSSKQVAQKIQEAIAAVTERPVVLVINTGGQDHRWLGNSHFVDQGIPVLAHENTAADIAERGRMLADSQASLLGPAFAGTRIQPPTRRFARRETLTPGGQTIEIIFAGGGHTPGDSLVWLPRHRIVFAGDVAYVDRLPGVLPMSNLRRWLDSFAALESLQPGLVVPGHGAPVPLARAQRETRDYLLLVRDHMRKAVAAGDDMQSAIRTLDDREFAYLPVYSELRGPNANRIYLEVEAE